MRTIWTLSALAILVGACVAGRVTAGGCLCAHCRCDASCRKVCRLVPDDKKVEVTCYGCKCEEFCLPCCSEPGCKHCDEVCTPDPKGGICTRPKLFVWREWCPGGAKIHTRKKLMKKIETKKIPGYKWVVEDLCQQCESGAKSVGVPIGTPIPPAPAAAEIVK